jgi:hexosaminidase
MTASVALKAKSPVCSRTGTSDRDRRAPSVRSTISILALWVAAAGGCVGTNVGSNGEAPRDTPAPPHDAGDDSMRAVDDAGDPPDASAQPAGRDGAAGGGAIDGDVPDRTGVGESGGCTGGGGRVDAALPSGPDAGPGGSLTSLIPFPRTVTPQPGEFVLTADGHIALRDPANAEEQSVAAFAAKALGVATGFALPIIPANQEPCFPGSPMIELAIDPAIANAEGYRLEVQPLRVAISAAAGAGLFYAVQTLRQMFPAAIESSKTIPGVRWSVPAVTVDDAPRLAYRGMQLDVSRHFFPVAFVEKYIDTISRYKMNRFHWHLTDDQGWRVEINQYPKLTSIGAWRTEADGSTYGGFYTQSDIAEVVRYAQERFVTIVPEIEMPGHCTAALAAYPEYSCMGGPIQVPATFGANAPRNVFCPTDATFQFLDNVLTEVLSLFPSSKIHVGSDEVSTAEWAAPSSPAQAVMQANGLTVNQLEGYFVARIDKFVEANGRTIVGWDEILRDNLPVAASVMAWHGLAVGAMAATQGRDVIQAPKTAFYFDYSIVQTPLATVYATDPVPSTLSPTFAQHILGGEGQVWSEHITPANAETMAFPRGQALAEVLWSPAGARTFADFRARFAANAQHLDAAGIGYCATCAQ